MEYETLLGTSWVRQECGEETKDEGVDSHGWGRVRVLGLFGGLGYRLKRWARS